MNDPGVTRVLTTIVMIDIVGYSRMMGEDEAGTLARFNLWRRQFIDAAIHARRGRIVKTLGDGMLLDFASVVDATRCAVELQQTLGERNASLPEAQQIVFRIGVNIGDVIVQGRDLYGDGVNVAARVEALAEPGGVCLSGAAYEQVRGKIDAKFVDLGAHRVKNIARPIEVFALSAEAIRALPRSASALAPQARRRRLGLIGAVAGVALGAALAVFFWVRGATPDLASQLDPLLAKTQANSNEKSRARLVADYLAIGEHRAFALAPQAQSHWWTGDWPSPQIAGEKALERCQLAFDEPCVLVAIDAALLPAGRDGAGAPTDMPRVHYSGDFDPAQIPGVRAIVAQRADVAGYLAAPSPKAAAIHPRGLLTIVTGAATQHRAEVQALKACNDDEARKDADGPCFLYAVENRVILDRRLTISATKP